ncbi:MAG TPA: thiamine pyrophosphate-binding protein [Acidimicrobiales bacterium]|nr:thiamine pyrophosphate-binding protein [Acidimicrobiales bacterium]
MSVKYADLLTEWLQELGYTHCFFVAGGNSMHLLDGARRRFTCVAVVHEVAAGIAAEYFNEAEGAGRAFVLVTAGPGMTNLVSALAGAYLESRELLVLGGQVKSVDLARQEVRQRGIQEVDGVAVARSVSVVAERIEEPVSRHALTAMVEQGRRPRKGPVFIEVCLDAQGATVDPAALEGPEHGATVAEIGKANSSAARGVPAIAELMRAATRPVLLLGGGVSRAAAAAALPALRRLAIPVMTTWNGMDRIGADEPFYVGRPNTWGQRSANVLLQQADVVVALGTRLGLQQTGFNWEAFAPLASVVQVDIDEAELAKGHPKVDLAVPADADAVLAGLVGETLPEYSAWLSFCRKVRTLLPLAEEANTTAPGYLCPYQFVGDLSARCSDQDVIVPCSSGGAFTVSMQAFNQRRGQIVITNKGLASMGYGLPGAVGAAIAHPERRTILLDGDGGFAQNMQELATVAVNRLNLKTFVFSNDGYASIRMTQRNYFDGQYLGCDTASGLGFPHWSSLFGSFGVPALELGSAGLSTQGFEELFEAAGPAAFIVPVDPEQTYFPKITSRMTATGGMESRPLHLMSPDLPPHIASEVFAYLGPQDQE